MERVGHENGAVEVLFTAEAHVKPFAVAVGPSATVKEFAKIAAATAKLDEPVEVYLEDSDQPLGTGLVLLQNLSSTFTPLHVARPGKIKTTVEYNGGGITDDFRPSVTIARVLRWAIGPQGFNLDKPASDFQLKHKGEVLSPDNHLGQIAGGQKKITLHLVFKVKPQG